MKEAEHRQIGGIAVLRQGSRPTPREVDSFEGRLCGSDIGGGGGAGGDGEGKDMRDYECC